MFRCSNDVRIVLINKRNKGTIEISISKGDSNCGNDLNKIKNLEISIKVILDTHNAYSKYRGHFDGQVIKVIVRTVLTIRHIN